MESKKYSDQPPSELAERIQRVENGTLSLPISEDQPSVQLTIQKLMEIYRIPGVSIAVIDDFKIAWAKGYGIREAGTSSPVTPRTLFQAGSVSKPVAAAGALALVEQGKLSLDEDVNQKLKKWKVPESEFTKEQKVTLRRLLSHSAGLTVHGFPGYDVDETTPTLVQVLNGEKPANTEPVRVDIVPGTKWRYSGGGTLVAQQLMMDVTGKPFPQIMQELVFDKIGMKDSTYEQPLPPEHHDMAASGTYANGTTVHGKWHIYPEMAAAGLWITPSDLAKFAIEIALSKKGVSNRILSPAMTQEMLSPQIQISTNGSMGLGFFLGDETRPDLFGHTGDDEGFQALLTMYGDSGQGAAIMTNSEFGVMLADYFVESIAREYGWKNPTPADRPSMGISAMLMLIAHWQGIETALQQYHKMRKENTFPYIVDEHTLVLFGYLLLGDKRPVDALQVLKLEVQEYPEFWNAYDTLAEVYMNLGENQLAIQNYEKSLELNPDNEYGKKNLKTLLAQD